MKKLHELLGLPLSNGVFGVEIECEGHNLNPIETETWITERDGSLRGAYPKCSSEYVMRRPVTGTRLGGAIDELINHQKNAEFKFSFRTSVHVHINVQKYTIDELLAFIYACLILEEPLMNFCGETRKGNRFCLRVRDAEGYDHTLNSIFQYGWRAIRDLDGDAIRYSAINIHALRKYGSVEFRGMRGNMDRDILIPWCHTLWSIRNVATKLGSPIAVYNEFIKKGNEEFAKDMMGKHFNKFNYPELNRDMANSFSLNIQLPHMFKDKEEEKVPTWEELRGAVPAGARVKVNPIRFAEINPAAIPPAPPQAEYEAEDFEKWMWTDAQLEAVALAERIGKGVWNAAGFAAKLSWYVRQYEIKSREF